MCCKIGVIDICSSSENTLRRKPDETDFDYHKRLVYGKLVDKTLSDYDYTELSPYVYGKRYSCDVARRMMYGSCKTLKMIDEENKNNIKDSSLLQEIETQKRNLIKERQKFFDQRREYNKLISIEGRQEHLYDALIKSSEKLSENIGRLYNNQNNSGVQYNFSDNEAILVFSDWHYGMVTDNVFNKYDTNICINRVKKTVSMARQRIQLHRCNKLHVVILGDLFHGAIHTSARVASEEVVCEQLMNVSEILAQSICELSHDVNEVNVYMTYGNHARTVQNKNDNLHRDNMERIIPWWLQQRLKDCSNIKIIEPSDNEFILVSACGYEICASHGDLDSIKTSPKVLVSLFRKKYNKDISCFIFGDKHHRDGSDELGIDSFLCGSLCGTDDYANEKRLYSPPSQLLLIINKDDCIDAEYRLKV